MSETQKKAEAPQLPWEKASSLALLGADVATWLSLSHGRQSGSFVSLAEKSLANITARAEEIQRDIDAYKIHTGMMESPADARLNAEEVA